MYDDMSMNPENMSIAIDTIDAIYVFDFMYLNKESYSYLRHIIIK